MAMTGSSAAEINVTPLIDVLLVLIIIFMVISPTLPRGIESSLPKPSSGPAAEMQPIVLEVLSGNATHYRLNGADGSIAEVGGRLRAAFANRSVQDRVLFLRADRALPYSVVASAAGVGRESGASSIALTTQSQAEQK